MSAKQGVQCGHRHEITCMARKCKTFMTVTLTRNSD